MLAALRSVQRAALSSTQRTARIPISLQCRLASDLPHDAFAVIIGGGVSGTSLAYHLTKRNIKDVVVLEKQTIASGTTWHSPGMVIGCHPSHRYRPMLAYSAQLYNRIAKETGVDVKFHQQGTIHLATNEAVMNGFRQYVACDYFQEGDVCKTTLIGPDEVKKLAPIVDTTKVLGALYTTGDGFVDPRALTKALAKGAENGGAIIVEHCPPFKLIEQPSGEFIVQLEDGREVKAKNIVNAAGLWANDVAKQTKHEIPFVDIEIRYAWIGPIPEMGKLGNIPSIIDHDSTFYLRQMGDDKLYFGAFDKEPIVRDDWRVEMPKDAKVEPNFEHLDSAYKVAYKMIPVLKGAPIEANASAITMTPDAYPLVGPVNWRQNYWLQTGYSDGVTSGGGLGKYLADWMVDGEPPSELFDTDPNRFARWSTHKFIAEKSRETMSMFFNSATTQRPAGRPTERVSGIYARLANQGGSFLFRNGWEVAQSFASPNETILQSMIREYEMATTKCAIVDLTWRGKIEVRGPDSIILLDQVMTNTVPGLGSITSSLMLTRRGNILAPFTIFHHDQYKTNFILLTDPERESRDLYWLQKEAAERKLNVQITIVSEYLASLAVVGPSSRDVLQGLTKSDMSDKGFGQRSTRLLRLNNVPAVAARTSTLTGQLSFELFHDRADTLNLYNTLMREGESYGITNCGQDAFNIMRLEHGFKLWGRELTLDTNPFECGLHHLVDLNKKDFIGKTSAVELSQKKWNRKLALLACDTLQEGQDWESIPKGNEVIRRQGAEERIGQITSGTFSVRLRRPIAYAWVSTDISTDDVLTVDIGGVRSTARLLEKPPAPLPENV
uniref:Dimethylglycine dehydrogenase n=1 Tax=Ascaris suum TaxID=6253 RepID=F1KV14_ASCSU